MQSCQLWNLLSSLQFGKPGSFTATTVMVLCHQITLVTWKRYLIPHQNHQRKHVTNVFPRLHFQSALNISAGNVAVTWCASSRKAMIHDGFPNHLMRMWYNCDLKANYGPGSQLRTSFLECNNCNSLLPCHNNKILLLLLVHFCTVYMQIAGAWQYNNSLQMVLTLQKSTPPLLVTASQNTAIAWLKWWASHPQ